jgi:CBS domain-containing protein
MRRRWERAFRPFELNSDVNCCSLDTNLAAATKIVWERDCGAVPVTDNQGKVVGIITDRDVRIATATRSRESDIPVRDVMSKTVHVCTPTDDVRVALSTMRKQKVRRLPVIGKDGRPAGIVSMNDLVLRATAPRGAELASEDVVEAFKSICAHSTTRIAAA